MSGTTKKTRNAQTTPEGGFNAERSFRYTDGYELTAFDCGDGCAHLQLEHDCEGAAAIILSREATRDLVVFLSTVIGTPPMKINFHIPENIEQKAGENLMAELEELCRIAARDVAQPARLFDWRCKEREYVDARHIIAFVLRDRHKLSYPRLGKLLGCNHASVLMACRRFDVSEKSNKRCYRSVRNLKTAYEDAKKRMDAAVYISLEE